MNLDYKGKLNIEHRLLEIPLEKHWVGRQWYSDSFPPNSKIVIGYNDTFGIARIEDHNGNPSFIGIMDIKPHLEEIVKQGQLSNEQKKRILIEAINLAQGNFDRYGSNNSMSSTAESMVEVTDMQEIDSHWFYHRHEEYEKQMERDGIKVVKIPFTSTPVKIDENLNQNNN